MILIADSEWSITWYPCLCRKSHFLSRAHLLWRVIHSYVVLPSGCVSQVCWLSWVSLTCEKSPCLLLVQQTHVDTHTHTHTQHLEMVCLHSWIRAVAWFMALWVRDTTQLLHKGLNLLPNWDISSLPCGIPAYFWTSIWEMSWNEPNSLMER